MMDEISETNTIQKNITVDECLENITSCNLEAAEDINSPDSASNYLKGSYR